MSAPSRAGRREGEKTSLAQDYQPRLAAAPDSPTPGSPASGSAAPVVLQLADVAFGYGGPDYVIDGFDISVRKGEIVSIVGPSGCGKSSLLQLISNLRKPNRGSITTSFAGKARSGSRSRQQHGCSMVFQEDTLLPWLRVRDNVSLYHRFRGTRRTRQVKQDVDRLLSMVGLADSARLWPAQLSGGMKRRVAMLTALAASPELLLLDEPFSALDEPTRVGVHRDLYRLVREAGTSVILVTHDLAEAISLSDRVVLLSRAPSRIVHEYHMPFEVDREVDSIRSDSRFLNIYAQLWHDMETQLHAGKGGQQ